MSIFGKIRQAIFGPRADIGSAEIRRGDGVWEALGGNTGAPSEASAMRVTAVYACVQLIAGAISAMPMHVYQRARDGDLKRDVNADLWWILNEEFAPRWPASAGWAFMVQSKLLHGDGFAEILRGRNGQVIGLMPIHPLRVEPLATPDGMRLIYRVKPDPTVLQPEGETGRIRVIDQDDMLHVAGFGFNGLRGMSALRNSLATAGRLAISSQEFSASFLENLGRPDFALSTDISLTDDQYNRLLASLEHHKGPKNSGQPMILDGGLDIKTLTMPLEEMQLLETRKFQVEEICRAFGVQPFMIGQTEKTSSWGTGVSAMGAGFVRYTLRDHLNAFQNEINRKFFRTSSRVAKFDTADLERADIGVMMSALRQAIGRAGEPAIMSVEEARMVLSLPKKMEGTPFAAPEQLDTTEPPKEPEQ